MIITEALINRLFQNEDELKSFVLNQNLIGSDIDNFQIQMHQDSPTITVTIDGEQVETVNYTDESKAVIAIQEFLNNLQESDITLLGSTIVTTYEAFSPLEGRYYSFDTEEEAVEKAKQITRALVEQYNVHVNRKVANEHGHFVFETTGDFAQAVENM